MCRFFEIFSSFSDIGCDTMRVLEGTSGRTTLPCLGFLRMVAWSLLFLSMTDARSMVSACNVRKGLLVHYNLFRKLKSNIKSSTILRARRIDVKRRTYKAIFKTLTK